jgi:hypothetical protein
MRHWRAVEAESSKVSIVSRTPATMMRMHEADGRCGVDGRWQVMADDRWQMADGRWQTDGDGRWQVTVIWHLYKTVL